MFPHVKVIANTLIGEIVLIEAYMYPKKNVSTMTFPKEEKHIKENEHKTKKREDKRIS